jgi:hypothetical protein
MPTYIYLTDDFSAKEMQCLAKIGIKRHDENCFIAPEPIQCSKFNTNYGQGWQIYVNNIKLAEIFTEDQSSRIEISNYLKYATAAEIKAGVKMPAAEKTQIIQDVGATALLVFMLPVGLAVLAIQLIIRACKKQKVCGEHIGNLMFGAPTAEEAPAARPQS